MQKAVGLRSDQPIAHYRLAICLGHLGRTEQARTALMTSERQQPGFLEAQESWRPYADDARNEHFFAGLRRHRLLG